QPGALDAAASDGRGLGFGDPQSFGSCHADFTADGAVVRTHSAGLEANLSVDARRRNEHRGVAAESREVSQSVILYHSGGRVFRDLVGGGDYSELAFATAGSQSLAPFAQAAADGQWAGFGIAGIDGDFCLSRLGDVA